MINDLLTADSVLIPFEEAGGSKQVSTIVAESGGNYASFDFVDDERVFPGAVFLVRSKLTSDRIKSAIEGLSPAPERLRIKSVKVVETSLLWEGQMVSAVEELTFSDADGRCLTLTQEGAYYAYNLTLRDGSVLTAR